MTTLTNRPLGVNSSNSVLHDAILAAGGIVVNQDEYTSGLDRTYDVRGLSSVHVEIENIGVTGNGLTYKIEKTRRDYASITDLVELDFNANIKTDTIVSAGIAANATVTMAGPLKNVFSNATITTLGVTGDVFAKGTATLLAVTGGATVVVNGLVYTAVSGPASEGSFDIDGGTDALDAIQLQNAVNEDTRIGTLGDVTAVAVVAVVTFTTDVLGTAGNAITLTETGTTITVSGSGTLAGGISGDTVTVNGLVYLAVAHTAADNTQFDVTGSDTADAVALGVAIGADNRTGTIGDITESTSTNIVTVRSTLAGAAGNAVTLVSSDGTRLAVTGSGTLANGVNADTVTVNGLVYTCVETKSNNTEFTDFSNDAAALDLKDSINADTRTGTLLDVTAERLAAVVTITSIVIGIISNAITLVSSDGTRVGVTGSGFLANGTEHVDDISDVVGISPESTAIRIRIKRETSGQDTILKGIFSIQ